jgi:hypothetical protein
MKRTTTNNADKNATAPIITANIFSYSIVLESDAASAPGLPQLQQCDAHPAGMDLAAHGLEPAAAGRLAIPNRRGLGLASVVARHAVACCPGERQI